MLTDLFGSFVNRMQANRPIALTSRTSIGMAAHGNSSTTHKALEALFASATGDFELILVDDFSPDDTLEIYREARKWHRNTRIFRFSRNLEYCQSVNALLCHGQGDHLIFLSNDIFVCPAYLGHLLKNAALDTPFGIFRGCSNYVDGDLPLNNVAIENFATREQYFGFSADLAYRHRNSAPVEQRFLVGDAFLVSRAVIEKIGTFDTRFFGYYCDQDFGLRAQIAGFRIALIQSAFALHHKHANIEYLSLEEQQKKLGHRHARVDEALGVFLQKWNTPMHDVSVHDIPWERLAQQPFDPARHYAAPKDYSGYLLEV